MPAVPSMHRQSLATPGGSGGFLKQDDSVADPSCQQEQQPVVDSSLQIQEAIMDVFKKSQKAEKESKGLINSARNFAAATAQIHNDIHHINAVGRQVSFDGTKERMPGEMLDRSEARLDFVSDNAAGAGASTIQPHQYAKLFAHSGFSPAAEEVYYACESTKMSRALVDAKAATKAGKSSSSNIINYRSASAGGSSSNDSSRSASPSSSSSKKIKRGKGNVDKKSSHRKGEEVDPIFHSSRPTSDAGSLQGTLAEACMKLRPSSADSTSSTLQLRLDEVDRHAVFSVGCCSNLKNVEGIEILIRRLIEPYRTETWKLSHLEATVCRIRAIYRWITAFVKLDAPPLPPVAAVTLQQSTQQIQQQQHQHAQGKNASSLLPNSGVKNAISKQTASPAVPGGGGKKVAVVTPPSASKQQSQLPQLQQQDENLLSENSPNSPLLFSSMRKPPPLAIPKFFPYKLEDCDDPDDADLVRSELEDSPAESNDAASSASPSFVIGRETSTSVFNSRLGDCHMVATLFSFMIRNKAARILPDSSDATEFSALGVKDATSSDLCAVSERKTVAGPTGRAADKCDAARSPSAARTAERVTRSNVGGGAHPCAVITVRGTLKGCIGPNGRPAGYIPWSWNLLTLPDGKKYLIDVSSSMCQISDKFCLVMGQHLSLADLKRTEAFTAAYNQANSSFLVPTAANSGNILAGTAGGVNMSSSNVTGAVGASGDQHLHGPSGDKRTSAGAGGGSKGKGSAGTTNVGGNVKGRDSSQQQANPFAGNFSSTSTATAMLANSYLQQQQQQNAAAAAAEREKQERHRELCNIVPSPQPVIYCSGPSLSSSSPSSTSATTFNVNVNSSSNNSSNNSNNNTSAILFLDSSSGERLEASLRDKPIPPVVNSTRSTAFPTFSNFADAPLALNAPILDVQTAVSNAQFVPRQTMNQLLLENAASVIKDNDEQLRLQGNASALSSTATAPQQLSAGGSKSNASGKANLSVSPSSSLALGGKADQNPSNKRQGGGGGGFTTAQQQQQQGIDSLFGYPQQSPTVLNPQNSQINESIANSHPHHYIAQHLLSISPASLLIKSFIPFFFFTPPQEFACSHFPRRAQHMLLSPCPTSSSPSSSTQQHLLLLPEQQQQPSQGVFKHPFSQGAWEAYPRLSHKFLELGLRLKSRARRSMFSISAPPEYISIDASRGSPERIESKLFIFKSTSAYQLHSTSPIAPTLPPVLVPSSTLNTAMKMEQIQQQQQQLQTVSTKALTASPPSTFSNPTQQQQQQQQQTQQRVAEDRGGSLVSGVDTAVVELFQDSQHSEPISRWVREQQHYLSKFWANIFSTSSPSSPSFPSPSTNATSTKTSNITSTTTTTPTATATTLQLSSPPSSAATRLRQALLPASNGWSATTCQRSTGTFTHTLMMPDVGVYTVVVGVREINPATGRPYEPFFWPAVTYQVTCNFVPTTEPMIASQREASVIKLVQPLISQLPAHASIPFAVAPLLPRVRGVAVVNAIERPRPTKQQLLQQQQQLQKEIMFLMQKEQQKDAAAGAGTANAAPNLPPVKGSPASAASKSTVGSSATTTTTTTITPPSNANRASTSSKRSGNVSDHQQTAPEPTPLQLLQQQLQHLIQQQANESYLKPVIERIQVHLLKWEPAAACFQGEVFVEPGNISIWAILETLPQSPAAAASSFANRSSPSSLASTVESDCSPSILESAIQQQQNFSSAAAAAAAGATAHHLQKSSAARGAGTTTTTTITAPNPSSKALPSTSPSKSRQQPNVIDGQQDYLLNESEGKRKFYPPELEEIASKIVSAPTTVRSLPKSMLPAEENVFFSKFNPLCLPADLQSRGMEQILHAVVPQMQSQQQQQQSRRQPSIIFGPEGGSRSGSKLSQYNMNNMNSKVSPSSKPSAPPQNSKRKSIVGGRKSLTPAGAQDAAEQKPVNVTLESFASSISQAANLHQSLTSSADRQPAEEDCVVTDHHRASNNSTPTAGAKSRSAVAVPTGNTANKNQSSSNQDDSNHWSSRSMFVAASLGSCVAFAVPIWTSIRVQRKIQSKDIAILTNGIGLGSAIGVSETQLGMTNVRQSFRRSSIATGDGDDHSQQKHQHQANNNNGTTTTTIAPQQFQLQELANRRHSLVYPVVLDLEERNAINLALCSAGASHMKAHQTRVGQLFQRKNKPTL